MTPYESGYNNVLIKLAVTPEMALRALSNKARVLPNELRTLGMSPIAFMDAVLKARPRTFELAASGRQFLHPSDFERKVRVWNVLKNEMGKGAF